MVKKKREEKKKKRGGGGGGGGERSSLFLEVPLYTTSAFSVRPAIQQPHFTSSSTHPELNDLRDNGRLQRILHKSLPVDGGVLKYFSHDAGLNHC